MNWTEKSNPLSIYWHADWLLRDGSKKYETPYVNGKDRARAITTRTDRRRVKPHMMAWYGVAHGDFERGRIEEFPYVNGKERHL